MTVKELRERQKWTLEQKIDHSLGTIEKFYNECKDNVYISFSGGKDSPIVLWLAKKLYPKWYDKFMKYENNGVTYREALRKMMMVNGKYLPDEEPLSLFNDIDFD